MNAAKIIRILALLLAVVMAFASVPYGALGLAVLGLLNGFMGVEEDRRIPYLLMAIALTMSASALNMVPAVGSYLTAIFSNIAAVLQAGVLALLILVIKERVVD